MYTTSQAAEQFGISKNTLLRWIAEGRVPDVKRDWRGWRVWSHEDLLVVKRFQQVEPAATAGAKIAMAASESMARFGQALAMRGKGIPCG